jgi:isoleucyl-tRNA synthetase
MAGFDASVTVGYDCHGLPIELKVDRELGRKARMSVADFCRACRAYAERYIGTMTAQFQRLGILGTWDAPYLTMNFKYQAAIARAFGRFVEQGAGLQGQEAGSLVHPLPDALAEAEVEYEDHTSPSIYVEVRARVEQRRELARRVPSSRDTRSRFSSGPRHRGRFRRTWRSPFTRSSTTPPTRWTAAP